jgi:hypothetical protein
MKTIQTIAKESISELTFSKNDVISNPEEQNKRISDLYRSQSLGNLLRTKVKITFEAADQQVYEVNTTVWAVGNRFVLLKGGTYLPIHAIVSVD